MKNNTEGFETLELVELVYEMIERGTKVPMSGKVMVDKKEVLEKLHDVINMYPQEVRLAQNIVTKKNDMLKEAEVRLSSARRESIDIIESQITNHDIVRDAHQRAEVIKSQASEESRQIRVYAREYANDLLLSLEKQIDVMTAGLLENMRSNIEGFAENITEDMEKTKNMLRENAKELEVPIV